MSSILCIMKWEDCATEKEGAMSALGDYVREVMEEQDVSQIELQRRTEIPDSTLSRILAGQEPKPTQVARIAKALGLKFWRLMQVGGYTTEIPGDPDEEARRLAAVLQSRPLIQELVRAAETLTTEEQEATLTYMILRRQQRQDRRQHRRRKKSQDPLRDQ